MKKNQPDITMQDLKVYPFWKIGEHQRLVVRFLPDLNDHNPYGFIDEFWFHTIVDSNGKRKRALCSATHQDNQQCYHCIIARREFNKETGWNKTSRDYWHKHQYTGNVIIIEDPLDVTDPNNPETYKLFIGKQLFSNIKEDITSNRNVTDLPSDYYNGNNFVITRERIRQYPNYTGAFQRTSRLNSEQIELAERSIIDLSEFRPKLYSSECQDDISKELMWEILGND